MFSVGIKVISNSVPEKFELMQNYPNPFNPNTIIRFQIKETRFVNLKVYDVLGKEVATLINEKLQAGTYEVPFSTSQFSESVAASGVYFYRLSAVDVYESGSSFSQIHKMVVLK